LGMELVDRVLEEPLVIHVRISLFARGCAAGISYTELGKVRRNRLRERKTLIYVKTTIWRCHLLSSI
ncbi:hypothetical protein, partial [Mesorhizobium sp.]|uniref:hypothetical protein n=1 Tax=Mesorhizobium sp. TaxID=1871066 RepID=UPI0025C3AEA4